MDPVSIFCYQNEIIKWAALVAWLRLAEVCNKALVSHHLEKAAEVAVHGFWRGGARGA